MPETVVRGARLSFTPDPAWSWEGWDGNLELEVTDREWFVDGRAVAIAEDVERMRAHLAGRAYVADGYPNAGETAQAMLEVDRGTLSTRSHLRGEPVVLATTTGTFRVTIGAPATSTGSSDSQSVRTGTWRFTDPATRRIVTD